MIKSIVKHSFLSIYIMCSNSFKQGWCQNFTLELSNNVNKNSRRKCVICMYIGKDCTINLYINDNIYLLLKKARKKPIVKQSKLHIYFDASPHTRFQYSTYNNPSRDNIWLDNFIEQVVSMEICGFMMFGTMMLMIWMLIGLFGWSLDWTICYCWPSLTNKNVFL